MDVLRSTEVTESLNTSLPHNAYADNAQFRIKAWKTTKKAVSSDMFFWNNEHFLTHTNFDTRVFIHDCIVCWLSNESKADNCNNTQSMMPDADVDHCDDDNEISSLGAREIDNKRGKVKSTKPFDVCAKLHLASQIRRSRQKKKLQK